MESKFDAGLHMFRIQIYMGKWIAKFWTGQGIHWKAYMMLAYICLNSDINGQVECRILDATKHTMESKLVLTYICLNSDLNGQAYSKVMNETSLFSLFISLRTLYKTNSL